MPTLEVYLMEALMLAIDRAL